MIDGGYFDLLTDLAVDAAIVFVVGFSGDEAGVDAGLGSEIFDHRQVDIGAFDHVEEGGAAFDGGDFVRFEDGVVFGKEIGLLHFGLGGLDELEFLFEPVFPFL